MGSDALIYNEGASSISLSTNLTLGDGSSTYYNGLTDSSIASLSLGGNFSIGETAFLITYGHSQAVVSGNVTLGSNSSLENGVNLDPSQTDAASFTVDGNFSIGNPGDAQFDNGDVENTGARPSPSTITSTFTAHRKAWSKTAARSARMQGPSRSAANSAWVRTASSRIRDPIIPGLRHHDRGRSVRRGRRRS